LIAKRVIAEGFANGTVVRREIRQISFRRHHDYTQSHDDERKGREKRGRACHCGEWLPTEFQFSTPLVAASLFALVGACVRGFLCEWNGMEWRRI
jgi:hypothetical protein